MALRRTWYLADPAAFERIWPSTQSQKNTRRTSDLRRFRAQLWAHLEGVEWREWVDWIQASCVRLISRVGRDTNCGAFHPAALCLISLHHQNHCCQTSPPNSHKVSSNPTTFFRAGRFSPSMYFLLLQLLLVYDFLIVLGHWRCFPCLQVVVAARRPMSPLNIPFSMDAYQKIITRLNAIEES